MRVFHLNIHINVSINFQRQLRFPSCAFPPLIGPAFIPHRAFSLLEHFKSFCFAHNLLAHNLCDSCLFFPFLLLHIFTSFRPPHLPRKRRGGEKRCTSHPTDPRHKLTMNIAQGMSQPLAGSAQVDLSKLPHTTATPPLGGNQSPEVRNGVAVVIPQQPQHQRQPDQGLHRSPVRQQGAEGQGHNPADTEQYGKIAKLMREADANIVRQIVRDQWEKCLTGSDYHSAFIV